MTAARQALLDAMTHDQAVDHLAEFAAQLGYLVYAPDRVKTSRGDHRTAYRHPAGRGFPDLTIAGLGWVIFVEVKTGAGRLEPEQRTWRDVLCDVEERADSRVVWILARPKVFHVIERFLATTDPTVLAPHPEPMAGSVEMFPEVHV